MREGASRRFAPSFFWARSNRGAVLRPNPHPSKTEEMRHPEIQLRSSVWCGRVCHPPDVPILYTLRKSAQFESR
jgi:hypothetical protein